MMFSMLLGTMIAEHRAGNRDTTDLAKRGHKSSHLPIHTASNRWTNIPFCTITSSTHFMFWNQSATIVLMSAGSK